MNPSNLHILLSVIEKNDGVNSLLNHGLSFSEIAELTNVAISEGLVSYDGNSIILTEKGAQAISRMREALKNLDKEEWIKREVTSQVEKIDIDYIYLPNRNEFFF